MELVELPVLRLPGLILPIESINNAILYTFARFCTGAELFYGENLFQVECLSKLLLADQLLWFVWVFLFLKRGVRKVSVYLVEAIEYCFKVLWGFICGERKKIGRYHLLSEISWGLMEML